MNSRHFFTRLLAFASLGIGCLNSAEFVIHNPCPESLSGTFAISAESLSTDVGPFRLIRIDSGREIPCQIHVAELIACGFGER